MVSNLLRKQRIKTKTYSSKTHSLVLNSIIGLEKFHNQLQTHLAFAKS